MHFKDFSVDQLHSIAQVSWVHPSSGSTAGGSFVVLLGSGFRHPAGPEPFGLLARCFSRTETLQSLQDVDYAFFGDSMDLVFSKTCEQTWQS